MKQSTHRLFMIRPLNFRANEQTADNSFQNRENAPADVHQLALREFDDFVDVLRSKGIHVFVRDSEAEVDTPDALFPNNWLSFHEDGRAAVYPMKAENRRLERREQLLGELCDEFGLKLEEIADFTEFENHNKFLEGTGSMVLDRQNKICYAALSERTDENAVELFCEYFGYESCCFETRLDPLNDNSGAYHTNVVMSIGTGFAVICDEIIQEPEEKKAVIQRLEQSGKEVIQITKNQLLAFAGNILEVQNEEGSRYIVMSETAALAFSENQLKSLEKQGELLTAPLPFIEKFGGGSARCMICEVFLPNL